VVIYELLERANAKALIYDVTFEDVLSASPVPVHSAVAVEEGDASSETLPDVPMPRKDDTVFIFHTSGSTSGRPKLVPCSYSWLDTVIRKSSQVCRPHNSNRQDVTVCMFVKHHFRSLKKDP
jgi:long-subunit acyl-CoA synthetase (AMP-forming)